jgi:serine/threonine protein kinase
VLQSGQIFGNFRIVRLIGEGGFGEVYLAENPLIGRRVAVKVLHAALAQDPELVRRFLNEARAASAIHHPNIVEVFDAGGTSEGAPYILMEFLEGVSLQERLADRGRFALPQVLDIASQAGSALDAAHAAGIVHRDLKPENLFLVPDADLPGGERVKVLDFGIAKMKHGGGTGGTVRTQRGLIMGSPAYMSPEQCKDSADVDLRSDIYSFATILYEMLAGRTPHVAATGTELLVMHLTETPLPLRELVADVPARVEAAIMRALARAREARFGSMADFLNALREMAGGTAVDLRQQLSPESSQAFGARPVARTERIISVRSSTTFSRSSGDLISVVGERRASVHRGRRIAYVGIAALPLCAVAVGVGLNFRARPILDGQGLSKKSATPMRPIVAPPQPLPTAKPPTINEAVLKGPDIPTADTIGRHENATADNREAAAKHPTVAGGERAKRMVKGRSGHARESELHAIPPTKSPEIVEPPIVIPQPTNPATPPTIIKHKKF